MYKYYKYVRHLPKPLRVVLKPPVMLLLAAYESTIEFRAERRRVRERRAFARNYYAPTLELIEAWARAHSESSNFYYTLTAVNRQQLAHMVAVVLHREPAQIEAYFRELEEDGVLAEHFATQVKTLATHPDVRVQYGRRIGWYAFVRALKPRLVVETGVDHGVGACVLASAVLRNRAEGAAGKYYGLEIRPEAAQLFSGRYAEAGRILVGDSIESLRKLDEPIDLFINDSDHSADYEYREYQEIRSKLSPGALILGDNSHYTDRLARFSEESSRSFLFFGEKPQAHWYPGAGIGISFPRRGRAAEREA
jgi:predicted O-methyltransferase YrrM